MHSFYFIVLMFFLGCYPERDTEPAPPPQEDENTPISSQDAGNANEIEADAGNANEIEVDAGHSTGVEADAGSHDPETNDAGSPPNDTQDAGQPDPCGQHQLEEVFEWPFSWPTPTAEVSIPEDEAFKTTITPFRTEGFFPCRLHQRKIDAILWTFWPRKRRFNC